MEIECRNELPETENGIAAENAEEKTIGDVLRAIDVLDSKIDAKIINDEWKNKKYDEMHSRMTWYQDDAFSKIANPILKSFIQLSDSIEKDIKYYSTGKPDAGEILSVLHSIVEQIDSILYSYDIEEYVPTLDVVNPKEQRICKIIETDDPALNDVVAEVVQKGYILKDRIFRQQKVNIYKYKEIRR